MSEAALGGNAVTVIGSCVRSDAEEDPGQSAVWLADGLAAGESELFSRLGDLCGRFAVVYRTDGRIHVVGDAACVRSIAYAGAEGVVASHAHLVQDNLVSRAPTLPFPEVRGYPGDSTPWPGTRLLSPNVALDVKAGTVRRFYPVETPERLSADDAAEVVLRRSTTALRNFACRDRPMVLGLTSGLDSRFALAIVRNAGLTLDAMTYVHDDRSQIDADVAGLIAGRIGLPHHVLDVRNVDRSTAISLLRQQSYHLSASGLVAELLAHQRPWRVFLSANLLEIGRAFYERKKPFDTPDAAAASFMRTMASVNPSLDRAGIAAYSARVHEEFTDYFARTGFGHAAQHLDSGDLLYWEHRMPAWHSQAILNRDVVLDTFIPFNSRSIFNALLSVGFGKRRKNVVPNRIIRQVLPEIRDIPVNPEVFPAPPAD